MILHYLCRGWYYLFCCAFPRSPGRQNCGAGPTVAMYQFWRWHTQLLPESTPDRPGGGASKCIISVEKVLPMAQGNRRSARKIKINESIEFEYSEECLSEILHNSGKGSNIWQQRNSTAEVPLTEEGNLNEAPLTEVANLSDSVKSAGWSVLNYLPIYFNPLDLTQKGSDNSASECDLVLDSRSQGADPNNLSTENINKTSPAVPADGEEKTAGRRLNSSTNYNFVDLQGNYLSAGSSTVFTGMGSTDSEGETTGIAENNVITNEGAHSSSKNTGADDGVGAAVLLLLEEMTKMRTEMSKMQTSMGNQNSRLEGIEQFLESQSGSESLSETNTSRKKGGKSKSSKVESDVLRQARKLVEKSENSKKSKVKSDKERSLRVSIDALKSRNNSTEESESERESSEDDFGVQGMKKKMTKKQKQESKQRVASRLKQVGSSFPEDESSNSSSGTESDTGRRCTRKKKVKSGEKVKKRPVVRTELWPHTVANEDDGDEVSSDTIGLAKFLSCFTYIMASCEDAIETSGRMWLLHAVTSVLEFWPWADARNFHNLVMIKLEQGRICWDTDFSDLANNFMEKKVRQGMRSRGAQAGGATNQRKFYQGYRRGYSGTSAGGNSSYSGSNGNSNRSPYSTVCRQWNNGTCSFGIRCRKSHVCWTCAENGRYGDHKAINHGSDGNRGRPNEQRS